MTDDQPDPNDRTVLEVEAAQREADRQRNENPVRGLGRLDQIDPRVLARIRRDPRA